jgi:hypothetical protein
MYQLVSSFSPSSASCLPAPAAGTTGRLISQYQSCSLRSISSQGRATPPREHAAHRHFPPRYAAWLCVPQLLAAAAAAANRIDSATRCDAGASPRAPPGAARAPDRRAVRGVLGQRHAALGVRFAPDHARQALPIGPDTPWARRPPGTLTASSSAGACRTRGSYGAGGDPLLPAALACVAPGPCSSWPHAQAGPLATPPGGQLTQRGTHARAGCTRPTRASSPRGPWRAWLRGCSGGSAAPQAPGPPACPPAAACGQAAAAAASAGGAAGAPARPRPGPG